MSTLFELSNRIEALAQILAEVDDEEEQEIYLRQFLKTSVDLKIKLDGYCSLIQEVETRAEVRRAEAKRLSDRATFDSNLAKRLKAILLWYLQENDIKKVETFRYQISRAKNGGKQPIVVNEDILVTSIDERFQKVSIDFDKSAIRTALENGETLNFASLGIRQESVRIK